MLHRMRKTLILQWTLLLTAAMSNPASGCALEDEVCEFWLVFQHTLTMMHRMAAVFPASGNIYRYDVTNVSAAQPLSVDNVVTADGWETQRLVMAINGTIPGRFPIVCLFVCLFFILYCFLYYTGDGDKRNNSRSVSYCLFVCLFIYFILLLVIAIITEQFQVGNPIYL